MNRLEFLLLLQNKLSALPQEDVHERLAFYNEMIDDRMEEGFSEEEAVAQIGNIDEIVSQIIADTPLSALVKEKIKPPKRLKPWVIVLLAVGSPLWLSLLSAAFAVVISLYAALWSVVISLWAAFGALVGTALGGVAFGIGLVCSGNALTGFALIGAATVCAGLSIFLFYGCKAATKGTALLAKKIVLGIKHCFIKKEAKQWITPSKFV